MGDKINYHPMYIKNIPFHVSGNLCVGERLLLNAETIEWTFLSSSSLSSSSSIKRSSKNMKVTTTTTRLKNIESLLCNSSSSSSSSTPTLVSSSSSSKQQQQEEEVVEVAEDPNFQEEVLLDVAIVNVRGKRGALSRDVKDKHETRSKKKCNSKW